MSSAKKLGTRAASEIANAADNSNSLATGANRTRAAVNTTKPSGIPRSTAASRARAAAIAKGREEKAATTSTRRGRPAPVNTSMGARTTALSSARSTTSIRSTASTRSTTSTTSVGSKRSATTSGFGNGSDGFTLPKRPKWDTKKRLEDMIDYAEHLRKVLSETKTGVTQSESALQESSAQLSTIQATKEELEAKIAAAEAAEAAAQEDMAALKASLEESKAESDKAAEEAAATHAAAIEAAENTRKDLEEQLSTTKDSLEAANIRIEGLETALAEQKSRVEELEAELENLNGNLARESAENQERAARIAELEAELAATQATVEDLHAKRRADEKFRRDLHNELQELKGNIRVFARIRPVLPSDGEVEVDHLDFTGEDDNRALVLNEAQTKFDGTRIRPHHFKFDKVFGPEAQQADVFEEIAHLVQSSLDGYAVSIFAYGQTGSGKTFTMEGADNGEQAGMIPRAVAQIFEACKDLETRSWSYKMEASYLEIYNDKVRDLLVSKSKDLVIRMDPATKTAAVQGLSVHPVASASDVFSILQLAAKSRSVGATQSNSRSSRSHSLFTLRLVGTNSVTEETTSGTLNLIDLAGSERLDKSKSEGIRKIETQCINKSLSALSGVIAALAQDSPHIPYRDSPLTHILSPWLGGASSKTLMFVNIDPRKSNQNESLCSLRFAQKVNSCDIGSAKRANHVDFSEFHNDE